MQSVISRPPISASASSPRFVSSTAWRLMPATARVYKMRLVTRNERDFAGCDIPVVNPFK